MRSRSIFSSCENRKNFHGTAPRTMKVKTENLKSLLKGIANLHGRTSYKWNGEDEKRGRKVWFNVLEHSTKSERHFWATMNYIHNNPVAAGLVSVPEDYYYSSARNYAGLNAPLEIIFESQELNRH